MACPSSDCKPGARLLGVRQDDGTIALLPEPLSIDEAFFEKVAAHPVAPERRFRFTNKCVKSGCGQWNGKGCGVIENVVKLFAESHPQAPLPHCAIRKTCRWYHQEGNDACRVCTFVVTDVLEEDINMPSRTAETL